MSPFIFIKDTLRIMSKHKDITYIYLIKVIYIKYTE